MAIGARSQSARTYLEKHLNSFRDCTLYELINHGIKALAGTLPNETKLNNKNLSICIVGKDQPFKCLDEAETEQYINPESAHGTGASDREMEAADYGVGGTERRTREPTPPPNPQDPIPEVATERRGQ
jgi:20S proteasome subunit alpha 6